MLGYHFVVKHAVFFANIYNVQLDRNL